MENKRQIKGKFKIFSSNGRIVIILNRVNREEAKRRKREEELRKGIKLYFKEIFIPERKN